MTGVRRALVVGAAISVTLSSARPARAEGWYGGPITAFDLGAAGLLAVGVATEGVPQKVALGLAAGAYLVPSPVVHGVHGRAEVGVGAVGLRLAFPLVLGLTGVLFGATKGGLSGLGYALVGGVAGAGIGVIVAAVVDSAALARESPKTGQVGAGLMLPPPALVVPWAGTF